MYLTRWSNLDRDFGRGFATLDLLRRRMDEMFREFDRPIATLRTRDNDVTWPRTNLSDTGTELVLCAAVPGLSENDLSISATGDVLTITGERTLRVPEGYSIHRQERGSVKFARSFTLPCKVDLEQTAAIVKDGMLTIRLAKAKEAQPRQITVKASS